MKLIGNTKIEFDKPIQVTSWYCGRNEEYASYPHTCQALLITYEIDGHPSNTLRIFYGDSTYTSARGSAVQLSKLIIDGQEIPVEVCGSALSLYNYLTQDEEERNTL